MPSPFPGMDPYLEGPRLWRGLHTRLISEIQEALNAQLGDRYIARIEDRVYISDSSDPGRQMIVPDIHLAPTGRESAAAASYRAEDPAGAVEMIELLDETITEPFVEIVDMSGRAVVTVIEVLSPTNKMPGATGREAYLEKRRRLSGSRTNLIEIDLLRAGDPVYTGQALPKHDYAVIVSRFNTGRRRMLLWPILLRQRLPAIPVPLLASDADGRLDLQAIFDQSYDRGKYRLDVDYQDAPEVPLSLEAARWSAELLQSKGFRK